MTTRARMHFLAILAVPLFAFAQAPDDLSAMEWRAIGPFNGGRGSSVVGHPTEPMVFWFGHSSGGLWRTDDAGTTWMPVGEGQFNYASVGAIAVHEKNPDIMYAGLGEPNMRQSVSWGDGLYKSVDGGATWQHMGLKTLKQIARIRIHPDDPDVVYVATPGHAFGPSEDRGVFRSRDGGKTWKKVLYKNAGTGAIDLVMTDKIYDVLSRRAQRPQSRRYVFTDRKGNARSYSGGAIRKAIKRAGLGPDVTPHVVRHTVATRLLESGLNIQEVQYIMGHADQSTTARYLHASTQESARRAALALNRRVMKPKLNIVSG